MDIEIGIGEKDRKRIAQGLSKVLAETYTLMLKTQNFHWNVTGPHFQQLHLLFMTHYDQLALAVDLVAERIRALGEFAPGSYEQFSRLATIKEETGVPSWDKMVKQLAKGHETVAKVARDVLALAQDAKDEATAELLTGRMSEHEKTAWMLRSHVEK